MPKNLRISIPQPCHEDWQQMTAADKGRHCKSCNKVVVDFTRMSDAQIVAYFKSYRQKTCGRFRADQLNKEMPLTLSQHLFRPLKYIAAALLAAEILSNNAQARDTADIYTPPVVQTDTTTDTSATISMCEEVTRVEEDTIIPDTNYNFTLMGDTWTEPTTPLIKPAEYALTVIDINGHTMVTLGICSPDPSMLPIKPQDNWTFLHQAKSFLSLSRKVFYANGNMQAVQSPVNNTSRKPVKKRWYHLRLAALVSRLKIISNKS